MVKKEKKNNYYSFSENDSTYKRFFKGSPQKKNQNEETEEKESLEDNKNKKSEYDISIAKGIFSNFKQKLASRGTRGYFAIARHLSNLDEKGTGTVDLKTFYKGLRDFRFELNEKDGTKIFDLFNLVIGDQISYIKLLRLSTGDLNEFRINILSSVFHKLDIGRQGITLDELKSKLCNYLLTFYRMFRSESPS
jgi:hypothetical protein